MGPDGHTPGVSRVGGDDRCGSAQELDQEPVAHEDPCRDPEEEDEEEGQNAGSGEEDEVGAHDSSNRSACSECGKSGAEVEDDVHQGSGDSAQEVEEQVQAVSEMILNVVTEDP